MLPLLLRQGGRGIELSAHLAWTGLRPPLDRTVGMKSSFDQRINSTAATRAWLEPAVNSLLFQLSSSETIRISAFITQVSTCITDHGTGPNECRLLHIRMA